jgi:hypothetical protein
MSVFRSTFLSAKMWRRLYVFGETAFESGFLCGRLCVASLDQESVMFINARVGR